MKNIINKLKFLFTSGKVANSNTKSKNIKSFEQMVYETPSFSLDSLIGKELKTKIDLN